MCDQLVGYVFVLDSWWQPVVVGVFITVAVATYIVIVVTEHIMMVAAEYTKLFLIIWSSLEYSDLMKKIKFLNIEMNGY